MSVPQRGQPYLIRDFRQGRYSPYSVSPQLIPDNSVANGVNVNFDTIVGSAVVRPGTGKLGNTVESGATPYGLAEFVGPNGYPNLLVAVYPHVAHSSASPSASPSSGVGSASPSVSASVSPSAGPGNTLWYFDGSWHEATDLTDNLSLSAYNRFATFGGGLFLTNLVDGMMFSTDADTWATTNCLDAATAKCSLVYRYKGRLLAAGNPSSGMRDRVYFSSIIAPNSSPFLTWNADPDIGDWIDVNPDDGGNITGFSETSTFVLVFKDNAMYRMDTVSKTTDAENIYNIGATRQEAIVLCQGLTYFFSGTGIYRTNGGFPDLISRAGVQDFIDAITPEYWYKVVGGTDGNNIYFSLGDITLGTRVYSNVVLKFSTRDQNWSVHSYADWFRWFANRTIKTGSNQGRVLVGADASGDVQKLNYGNTDNTNPIYYELETQDIEFGNRAHTKKINDKVVVFSQYASSSRVEIKADDKDPVQLRTNMDGRVNVSKDNAIEGKYFRATWSGHTKTQQPVFEGIYFEDVIDQGIM
jgi:hypothetical protein